MFGSIGSGDFVGERDGNGCVRAVDGEGDLVGVFVVYASGDRVFGVSQKIGDGRISLESDGANHPEDCGSGVLCVYARAGDCVLGEDKGRQGRKVKKGMKTMERIGCLRLKKLGKLLHYKFHLCVYKIQIGEQRELCN